MASKQYSTGLPVWKRVLADRKNQILDQFSDVDACVMSLYKADQITFEQKRDIWSEGDKDGRGIALINVVVAHHKVSVLQHFMRHLHDKEQALGQSIDGWKSERYNLDSYLSVLQALHQDIVLNLQDPLRLSQHLYDRHFLNAVQRNSVLVCRSPGRRVQILVDLMTQARTEGMFETFLDYLEDVEKNSELLVTVLDWLSHREDHEQNDILRSVAEEKAKVHWLESDLEELIKQKQRFSSSVKENKKDMAFKQKELERIQESLTKTKTEEDESIPEWWEDTDPRIKATRLHDEISEHEAKIVNIKEAARKNKKLQLLRKEEIQLLVPKLLLLLDAMQELVKNTAQENEKEPACVEAKAEEESLNDLQSFEKQGQVTKAIDEKFTQESTKASIEHSLQENKPEQEVETIDVEREDNEGKNINTIEVGVMIGKKVASKINIPNEEHFQNKAANEATSKEIQEDDISCVLHEQKDVAEDRKELTEQHNGPSMQEATNLNNSQEIINEHVEVIKLNPEENDQGEVGSVSYEATGDIETENSVEISDIVREATEGHESSEDTDEAFQQDAIEKIEPGDERGSDEVQTEDVNNLTDSIQSISEVKNIEQTTVNGIRPVREDDTEDRIQHGVDSDGVVDSAALNSLVKEYIDDIVQEVKQKDLSDTPSISTLPSELEHYQLETIQESQNEVGEIEEEWQKTQAIEVNSTLQSTRASIKHSMEENNPKCEEDENDNAKIESSNKRPTGAVAVGVGAVIAGINISKTHTLDNEHLHLNKNKAASEQLSTENQDVMPGQDVVIQEEIEITHKQTLEPNISEWNELSMTDVDDTGNFQEIVRENIEVSKQNEQNSHHGDIVENPRVTTLHQEAGDIFDNEHGEEGVQGQKLSKDIDDVIQQDIIEKTTPQYEKGLDEVSDGTAHCLPEAKNTEETTLTKIYPIEEETTINKMQQDMNNDSRLDSAALNLLVKGYIDVIVQEVITKGSGVTQAQEHSFEDEILQDGVPTTVHSTGTDMINGDNEKNARITLEPSLVNALHMDNLADTYAGNIIKDVQFSDSETVYDDKGSSQPEKEILDDNFSSHIGEDISEQEYPKDILHGNEDEDDGGENFLGDTRTQIKEINNNELQPDTAVGDKEPQAAGDCMSTIMQTEDNITYAADHTDQDDLKAMSERKSPSLQNEGTADHDYQDEVQAASEPDNNLESQNPMEDPADHDDQTDLKTSSEPGNTNLQSEDFMNDVAEHDYQDDVEAASKPENISPLIEEHVKNMTDHDDQYGFNAASESKITSLDSEDRMKNTTDHDVQDEVNITSESCSNSLQEENLTTDAADHNDQVYPNAISKPGNTGLKSEEPMKDIVDCSEHHDLKAANIQAEDIMTDNNYDQDNHNAVSDPPISSLESEDLEKAAAGHDMQAEFNVSSEPRHTSIHGEDPMNAVAGHGDQADLPAANELDSTSLHSLHITDHDDRDDHNAASKSDSSSLQSQDPVTDAADHERQYDNMPANEPDDTIHQSKGPLKDTSSHGEQKDLNVAASELDSTSPQSKVPVEDTVDHDGKEHFIAASNCDSESTSHQSEDPMKDSIDHDDQGGFNAASAIDNTRLQNEQPMKHTTGPDAGRFDEDIVHHNDQDNRKAYDEPANTSLQSLQNEDHMKDITDNAGQDELKAAIEPGNISLQSEDPMSDNADHDGIKAANEHDDAIVTDAADHDDRDDIKIVCKLGTIGLQNEDLLKDAADRCIEIKDTMEDIAYRDDQYDKESLKADVTEYISDVIEDSLKKFSACVSLEWKENERILGVNTKNSTGEEDSGKFIDNLTDVSASESLVQNEKTSAGNEEESTVQEDSGDLIPSFSEVCQPSDSTGSDDSLSKNINENLSEEGNPKDISPETTCGIEDKESDVLCQKTMGANETNTRELPSEALAGHVQEENKEISKAAVAEYVSGVIEASLEKFEMSKYDDGSDGDNG